jgi:hypothetical protein
MTPEQQKELETLPAEEPRSRLEPYRELILLWRSQGRSYRRIQDLLLEKCQCRIAFEPLRRYVNRRSRPRKPKLAIKPESAQMAQAEPTPTSGKRVTPEERAAQVAYIRSLNKPAVAEEQPKLLFDYDPDKPRTNEKPKEEKDGINSARN